MDAAVRELGVQAAHKRHRIGREIEIGASWAAAGQEPVGAKGDRLDLRRAGKRGEDHVATLCERARRIGPGGTARKVRFSGSPAHIVHDQLIATGFAGRLQMSGHVGAHGPQTDEPDVHALHPSIIRQESRCHWSRNASCTDDRGALVTPQGSRARGSLQPCEKAASSRACALAAPGADGFSCCRTG